MPFKGYQTYYRIVGEKSDRAPLLLLHGGPGSTHNYMEVFDELSDERQVISYDQLGCGNSYLDGHPELWKLETWLDELKSLISYLKLDRVHLLGQSWGGMLLIAYLLEAGQKGVCSATLSSTLPASWLWGREQHRLIRFLSEEDQKAIYQAEQSGDFTSEAYKLADQHFMERHCSSKPTENDPECLHREKKSGREAYVTAWGPDEYTPIGTLKDFDYIDQLNQIKVPTLICSGINDMCTPLIAKLMHDKIPDSSWHLFDHSRHMCYVEQHDEYCKILREFLNNNE